MKRYFWNILIAMDQFVNTVFGGDPDETISSVIGKKVRNNEANLIEKMAYVILNHIEEDHCENSIEEDEGLDDLRR